MKVYQPNLYKTKNCVVENYSNSYVVNQINEIMEPGEQGEACKDPAD